MVSRISTETNLWGIQIGKSKMLQGIDETAGYRECELAGKKLAIVQGSHDPFKIRHMCMH